MQHRHTEAVRKAPFRRWAFAVCAVVVGSVVLGRLFAQTPTVSLTALKPQPFALTITPVRSIIKSSVDRVIVRVVVTNVSDQTISFVGTSAYLDYHVIVLNSDGTEPSYTDKGRSAKDFIAGRSTIPLIRRFHVEEEPGKTFSENITVDDLYEMTRPGQYAIQVERDIPEKLGGGMVKSNFITVTVTE